MHAGFPESSAVKGIPEAYRWYPGEWKLGTMCCPHDEGDPFYDERCHNRGANRYDPFYDEGIRLPGDGSVSGCNQVKQNEMTRFYSYIESRLREKSR